MAAPREAAMPLAKSVLPVPGGPQKIMPLGISSSMRLISSASFRRSLRARMSRISERSCFLTVA